MRAERQDTLSVEGSNDDCSISSEEMSGRTVNIDKDIIQTKYPKSTQNDFGANSPQIVGLDYISSRNSPKTASSLKVSRSKVTKCKNRKNTRKVEEIETPSKETASIFDTMQLGESRNVTRLHLGQEDVSMVDADDADFKNFNYEENENSENFSEGLGERAPDSECLITSIEHEHEKGLLWAQRSELSKEIARTVGSNHPSIPTSYNSMEKSRKKYSGGPVDPNGRWPRMMEKLLLNIQYECFKAKIRIPWDEIVHRLEPGCSGPSAVQMLNKMRDVLIVEGHMIPPAMGNGIQPDPDIRGYVRDLDSEFPGGTRILRWTESYPNASRSLSDSGFVRGSGNYRKVLTRGGAFNKIPRTIEERGHARTVIPEEAYSLNSSRVHPEGKNPKISSVQHRRGKPRALWKKPGPKGKIKGMNRDCLIRGSEVSPNPESEPGIDSKTVHQVKNNFVPSGSRSGCESKINRDTSHEETNSIDSSDIRHTPSKTWSTTDEEGFKSISAGNFCDVHDGKITVDLPSVALGNTDLGRPINHPNNEGHSFNRIDLATLQEQDSAEDLVKSTTTELMNDKICNQSYKGVKEHGNLPDFVRALVPETDPRLNGWKYLKLVERLEKIEEKHTTNPKNLGIKKNMNEKTSGSDKFMETSVSNDISVNMCADITEPCLDSWSNSDISPELQSSFRSMTEDISAKYNMNSDRLYENISQDNYFGTGLVNNSGLAYESKVIINLGGNQQENILPTKPHDEKNITAFEKEIFRSSTTMCSNPIQECHFSTGGVIFEDEASDFTEVVSAPKSAHLDFYEDHENNLENNFQISAWQNEFINEPHDDLSQGFES
ncbi:putative heat shock protein mitochondrial precursor protein [Golovinomyces cichoracearum]|uniref:Putative heat shock protein mitochondrial protein n=1 Tax=Golovinomyces cichoracearum TaxID=62708 RepID=A0A420J8U1_9PEZI|nr:putative heat shock protein mitochondrial precursor protein [Golovinomyces cichoracearum]